LNADANIFLPEVGLALLKLWKIQLISQRIPTFCNGNSSFGGEDSLTKNLDSIPSLKKKRNRFGLTVSIVETDKNGIVNLNGIFFATK